MTTQNSGQTKATGETYHEARDKFLTIRTADHFLFLVDVVDFFENNDPLAALSLATELQRLMLLRANESALAREENLGGKA